MWPGLGGRNTNERGSKVKRVVERVDRQRQDRLDRDDVWVEQKQKNRNYANIFDRQNRARRSQKKMSEDRCFGIRHKTVSGEVEMQNDSIVTNSVLLMTGYSSVDENEFSETEEAAPGDVTKQSREDMDRVIQELAAAVRHSKGVSVLTKAVEKSKQNNKNQQYSNSNQQYSNQQCSKSKHHAYIEKEKQQRRRTEDRNFQQPRKKSKYEENFGYISEDSEISVPRKGNDNRPQTRAPSSLSHSTSSTSGNLQLSVKQFNEQRIRKPKHLFNRVNQYNQIQPSHLYPPHHSGVDPASWFLARRDTRPLHTDLDFKNYRYNYGLFRAEEMLRSSNIEKNKTYKSKTGSYFIEGWNQDLYKRKKRKRQTFLLFLKTLCFLLLLSSFVLVIVAVSVFLNTGHRRT